MATTFTPIAEQERAKRQEAFREAVAHLRIEDLHVGEELECLFQRHIEGEFSDEELGAAIDELNERLLRPLPLPRNGRS